MVVSGPAAGLETTSTSSVTGCDGDDANGHTCEGGTVALEHGQVAPVHAVQNAMRLLEAVDKHEHGVSADQLIREVDLPSHTATHLIAMLLREKYLRRLKGGGYVLGDAFLRLGGADRRRELSKRL